MRLVDSTSVLLLLLLLLAVVEVTTEGDGCAKRFERNRAEYETVSNTEIRFRVPETAVLFARPSSHHRHVFVWPEQEAVNIFKKKDGTRRYIVYCRYITLCDHSNSIVSGSGAPFSILLCAVQVFIKFLFSPLLWLQAFDCFKSLFFSSQLFKNKRFWKSLQVCFVGWINAI